MSEKDVFSLDVVAVKINPEFKVFSDKPLCTPGDVSEIACKLLSSLDRESMVVFNLNAKGKPLSAPISGVGTLESCIAHPREMIKAAFLTNAASIILAHNHPSGSLNPSEDDIILTARMIKICNLIGIKLLDHIIVAGGERDQYLSMLEQGIIESHHEKTSISKAYLPEVAERGFTYGVYDNETRHR